MADTLADTTTRTTRTLADARERADALVREIARARGAGQKPSSAALSELANLSQHIMVATRPAFHRPIDD